MRDRKNAAFKNKSRKHHKATKRAGMFTQPRESHGKLSWFGTSWGDFILMQSVWTQHND